MTMTPKDFLKAFPAFRSSDNLVREFLSAGQVKAFPAGMNIYSEGDACSAIAFVLSGEVRVYKTGETGREITLYEIGPGETCILNASCLLSGTSYPAHAATSAEGSMLLVPAPDFRRMIAEHEPLRDFVFALLSQRLSLVMELIEEVAFAGWTSVLWIISSKNRKTTNSKPPTRRSPATSAPPAKW
jgi:CRP/FNR family transcriptional regulator